MPSASIASQERTRRIVVCQIKKESLPDNMAQFSYSQRNDLCQIIWRDIFRLLFTLAKSSEIAKSQSDASLSGANRQVIWQKMKQA